MVNGKKKKKDNAMLLCITHRSAFRKAINIARVQHAKSLELRAVMSLVHLRQIQATQRATPNTPPESRGLLSEAHQAKLIKCYPRSITGSPKDLRQNARALLDDLTAILLSWHGERKIQAAC